MNKEFDEILQKAIDTYGKDAQQDMCIEEMAELTKAICKIKRNKYNVTSKLKQDLFEELADVYIMLEQLVKMYNCEPEVRELMVYKIRRLEGRLREDE